MADKALRAQLADFLDWKNAHVGFDDAVKGIPPKLRGAVPAGLAHSVWEIVEHVRIAPQANPFLRLVFIDYPISHSLAGAVAWGLLFAGGWALLMGRRGAAPLLFLGVVSHWVLDVVAHTPDVPVLPHGPYLGFGLWNSPAWTIAVETTMFASGIAVYARTKRPRASLWALLAVLFALYLGSIFGPPPPNVTALGVTALAGIAVILPWAWWADRG